jgi:hypothetical protein
VSVASLAEPDASDRDDAFGAANTNTAPAAGGGEANVPPTPGNEAATVAPGNNPATVVFNAITTATAGETANVPANPPAAADAPDTYVGVRVTNGNEAPAGAAAANT